MRTKFDFHRSHLLIFFLALAVPSPSAASSDIVHHRIEIGIDPASGSFKATDTVTLPDSSPAVGGRISFLLHEGLNPSAGNPSVGLRVEEGVFPFAEYVLDLPRGVRTFTLEYGGVIDHPLENVGEEYARGQKRTAGRIFEGGVFLSQSSGWYPIFEKALCAFSLTVSLPPGWEAVSQGRRTHRSAGEEGVTVRWEEDLPQDSIYLVAGKYTEYSREEGKVSAMVFLREPDTGLAERYLEATLQYVSMYADLIGPYPYGKFALVENFWETGYGMPSFTLLGPKVLRFPFILHSSYPHEILHNWWGNSVFIDYESGNWGEGLTAYLSDHLVKEQRKQGAQHRMTTLQKYTDYVLAGRDLLLSDFRSRHGSVTEAVGYGKSLMFFHMLRRSLGDAAFREGLRDFYTRNLSREADFGDLRSSFEGASKRSLEAFFRQWLFRTGAPLLEIEAEIENSAQSPFLIRGKLRQVQGGEPFFLDVPVAVTLEGQDTAEMLSVPLASRTADFEFSFTSRPLRVDVDPAFDLFRRLHPLEIPSALTTAFGAEKALILTPSSADEETAGMYRDLSTFLSRTGPGEVTVAGDDSLETLPADRSVWLLGWENRFFPRFLQALEDQAFSAGEETVLLERTEITRAGGSFVVTARHPANSGLAILWIGVDTPEAVPGLGRKLPHYHKYSYLAFTGAEPENVAKGRWPVHVSPLTVLFTDSDLPPPPRGKIPPGKPLASLEPLFSRQRMVDTIAFLSSPALGGRELGTDQIEEVSSYIAESFSRAGLAPGGDGGESYFQTWTQPVGKEGRKTLLRNVIGIIPGTEPAMEGQSVVVGAHYDHLGKGDGQGGPEVLSGNAGLLHPGADDNASGIAVLLELARVLGQGFAPDRSVVFAAFTGEESGKIGSRRFVETAGADFPATCRAMINLDTVGRLGERKLMVLGGGSAREWVHIFRGAGYLSGVEVEMVKEDLDSSDHVCFQDVGIPAVQLFAGPHLDYHRPGDTADKIDVDGLVRIAALTREAVQYLTEREEPLTSASAPPGGHGGKSESSRKQRKSSLGTIPDFAFSGDGVRLEGVAPGSPAEQAGLLPGDVLLNVGGMPVSSLRDLSDALKTLEPGAETTVIFQRGGQRRETSTRLEVR